jgi:glucoamylase
MPLLWAHAEYLKLLIARDRGKPIELLESVETRYADRRQVADTWHWRVEAGFSRLTRGRSLSVEHRSPFSLHYGFNGWEDVGDRIASRGPFGVWSVTFTEAELAPKTVIDFTRRFDTGWEGQDHRVSLGHAQVVHALTHQGA